MLMLLIGFLSSVAVHAESPNPPRAGRIEGRATYSYYSTESNFSSTGGSALMRNGSLTQMQGDFMATYDWQPDWRFSVGFNAAWVETDDGLFNRSNSGMNDGYASAQKWFESGPLDITPQLDFVFPFWRVDEKSDEAIVGEGAMRIRAGSWAFWPLGTYKPFVYAGFEYRDGGRAYLLPYEVGIKFKLPAFWIQTSFRGYETVVDDADTENQFNRETYLRTVNGGSLRFYSVNPSGSEGAIEAGTQFGSWGLHAGFSISINGNNSADGWMGYGGISWSPVFTRPKKQDDGFSIRKERFDETLFVEDPPVPPPAPPAPVSRESVPAVPPPPARPAKPVDIQIEMRPAKPKKSRIKRSKNLNKLMNDAESALENAN